VKDGRFRQDLFYRINAYTVIIPPLRERKNDIILLAEHFRKRYEKQYKKTTLGFTDLAVEALHSYNWPGNIRELENTIERSIILTDDQNSITELTLFNTSHSSLDVAVGDIRKINQQSGQIETIDSKSYLKNTLAEQVLYNQISLTELEETLIEKAMDQSIGKVSVAARLLGLSRAAFAYRLKRIEETKDNLNSTDDY